MRHNMPDIILFYFAEIPKGINREEPQIIQILLVSNTANARGGQK